MLSDSQILRVLSAELIDAHGDTAFDVGEHAIQATIRCRLKGSVEQLPPQEYVPTVDIPLLSVLAIVAQKLGVRSERLYSLILDAAMEAHAAGDAIGDYLEFGNRALAKAKDRLREGLPKKTRKGALRRIVALSDVDIDGSAFSAARARPVKRRRGA